MPRTKKQLRKIGYCVVEELVTETYTLRQDMPDGRTLRHDGETLWCDSSIGAWYGVAPKGWDSTLAVRAFYHRTYTQEADYS